MQTETSEKNIHCGLANHNYCQTKSYVSNLHWLRYQKCSVFQTIVFCFYYFFGKVLFLRDFMTSWDMVICRQLWRQHSLQGWDAYHSDSSTFKALLSRLASSHCLKDTREASVPINCTVFLWTLNLSRPSLNLPHPLPMQDGVKPAEVKACLVVTRIQSLQAHCFLRVLTTVLLSL